MTKRFITILIPLILATSFATDSLASITLSVSPTADMILPGSIRSVYSNTLGEPNTTVSWTVNGGTILDSTGYFVTWKAPSIPGNYTVKATSSEDGTTSAQATFTVISTATVRLSNIPVQATIFKGQPLVIQSIIWGSTNTDVTWTSTGGSLTGSGREIVFRSSVAGTYEVTATSNADPSKTATTTIVTTNNTYPAASTTNKTQPVDCTATGSGTTYEVTTEATMDDVPWATIGAGDTVRIHPGIYHKQLLIATSGTESQPIRICGVPDGSGNLPELNGANATAKADSDYNSAYSLQKYGGLMIYNHSAAYYGGAVYPENIIIEGLKFSGFNRNNTFTDVYTSTSTAYNNGVASIRVQHGRNITIRGNELTDSGNGLFSMWSGIESKTTRNLLVEGNYIHTNGLVDDYLEHQSYLQAAGLVVQGNYYDHPRIGMPGGQLKTRAAQQFIRYNYFNPASRIIDIVEVQDALPAVFPWIGLLPGELPNTSVSDVVANHESYQDQYIYGNIINNIGTRPSAWTIHVAADNNQAYNHGGTVFFYHNTMFLSLFADDNPNYRSGIVDAGPYGGAIGIHNVWPTVRITNNAIYIAIETPWAGKKFFWNRWKADRVILDRNWITTEWGTGNLAGGDGTGISNKIYEGQWQGGTVATQVAGVSNLITGNTIPFDTITYAPSNGSPLINSSTSLPDAIKNLPPLMKYDISTHTMRIRANSQDIGAVNVGYTFPLIKKITEK